MRLLHSATLQFEEFFDSDIPKYAILSHRWEGKEISFQEFQDSEDKNGARFAKIRNFCSLAVKDGLEWVWVDTCCIDKKSSAELSEAINSMFRWYKNAERCYAYLSDVIWAEDKHGGFRSSLEAFRQSVWFTRGWTLQELLAPSSMMFFDERWEAIGTKRDLLAHISATTGIGDRYIQNLDPPKASVAMKMSWASRRETSRIEDVAYCLLGLFDVNMPLLYGEGKKAFLRLELEIIRKSDDESIFAWTSADRSSGLLASWPSAFADSGDICRPRHFSPYGSRLPYSMTNLGLQIQVPRPPEVLDWDGVETFMFKLRCVKNVGTGDARNFRSIAIYLQGYGYFWHRVGCHYLDMTEPGDDIGDGDTTFIYVRQPGL